MNMLILDNTKMRNPEELPRFPFQGRQPPNVISHYLTYLGTWRPRLLCSAGSAYDQACVVLSRYSFLSFRYLERAGAKVLAIR